MIEIFFPTKDRNIELKNCLESIFRFHDDVKVSIANCSIYTESTSEVLREFPVNEIILSPDPGMNQSFNVLIENITEPFSIWLSDDIILLKPLTEAYNHLIENNFDSLGIGFIDNIHYDDYGWPVDEFQCAKWVERNIRISHFALCKSNVLKNIFLSRDAIDVELYTQIGHKETYKYFESYPFLKHDRYMDNTRINRIL